MLRGYVMAAFVLGGAWMFAAPAASLPQIGAEGARAAGAPILILKGFGKKDKDARRKKDREGKREGGGGGGRCKRLAAKHGLPASECGGGSGSCKRLAEKYGLSPSACR